MGDPGTSEPRVGMAVAAPHSAADITVVIPAYQRAATVARAVESALGQVPAAPSVVVVDDGSTDGTDGILRGFGDRIVAIHQANAGVSTARNAGIARVRTPWVAFLDSDDALHPGALAAACEAIEGPREACLFSAAVHEDDEPTGETMSKPTPGDRYTLASLLGPDEAYALPCGVFPLDQVQALGGFDARVNGSEDYVLLLRLAARGIGLRIVREPLFDKEEGGGPRLSVDEVQVLRNKLAALEVFRELEPTASRVHRSLLRAREGRYLTRIGRKIPALDPARGGVEEESRVPARTLLRAWTRRPLALDVLGQGLFAYAAPRRFHRWRSGRAS